MRICSARPSWKPIRTLHSKDVYVTFLCSCSRCSGGNQEGHLNQFSAQPLGTFIRNRSRSMGIKLVVVSCLALLMAIPAVFVMNIVEDRTNRAKEVVQEISSHVGGQQIFLGPVLAIPYSIPPAYKGGPVATGTYVVFPSRRDAAIKLRTAQRRRSLCKVPVFQA